VIDILKEVIILSLRNRNNSKKRKKKGSRKIFRKKHYKSFIPGT